MPTDGIESIRQQRMETWRVTIEQELQTLLNEAAEMRRTIIDAKTSTKKKYYNKKFKKISDQVVQLLTVQSQLPPREQPSVDTSTDIETEVDSTTSSIIS